MSRQEVTKLPPYYYTICPSEIQNHISSGITPSETTEDDFRFNVYFEHNFDPPCSEIIINAIAKTNGETLNTLWFHDGAIHSFIQMMNPPAELHFKPAIFTSMVEADHDIDAFLENNTIVDNAATLLANNVPVAAGGKDESSGNVGKFTHQAEICRDCATLLHPSARAQLA